MSCGAVARWVCGGDDPLRPSIYKWRCDVHRHLDSMGCCESIDDGIELELKAKMEGNIWVII